jgi:xanthine dehydrogenase YagT iron-sulfur-binding subunit
MRGYHSDPHLSRLIRARRKDPMTMDEYIVDRRTVLSSGAVMAASLSITPSSLQAKDLSEARADPQTTDVMLSVNGTTHSLHIDTRMTLLDALREKLHLTGSKKGCDQGQCGACTVHIDGERHLSCLTLAVAAQGHQVATIEGLAQGDRLHPMQQAFIDHDAFQCGYCTSGQIMSAVACVSEGHSRTDEDIREYMSGNLCRCAAYPNIVAAIKQAKTAMERS